MMAQEKKQANNNMHAPYNIMGQRSTMKKAGEKQHQSRAQLNLCHTEKLAQSRLCLSVYMYMCVQSIMLDENGDGVFWMVSEYSVRIKSEMKFSASRGKRLVEKDRR